MKNQIYRSQVITIQKYKRWARIDDATYRDILQRAAGVNSSKFLTQRQFDVVMSWLEALLWDRADAGLVPAPVGLSNVTALTAPPRMDDRMSVAPAPSFSTPCAIRPPNDAGVASMRW